MTLAANETALVGLWFDGQKYDMEGLNGGQVTEKETPVLKKAVQWLDEYFAGRMPAIMSLPLAPEGNEFRRPRVESPLPDSLRADDDLWRVGQNH